jgi:hypothetical protein
VALYEDVHDQDGEDAAGGKESEIESVLDSWFSVEAQTTMRSLVERLARKRGGGAG